MVQPAVATKPPFREPGLPIVAEKPATAPRMAQVRLASVNDVDHPRVAKDLGRGPYRNKFGATCVALVQAKGLAVGSVGFAKNIPAIARAAGYRVDQKPAKGAVFITAESSAGGTDTGHSGIVLDNSNPDYLYVQEQNYEGGHLTEGWLPRARVLAIIHI